MAEAERAEQQRQADMRREQQEQEAREADEAHRASVKAKAIAAMVNINIAPRAAERLVQAICANDIPHVSMRF